MRDLTVEQAWANGAADSAEKLRAEQQATLDRGLAENEAELQNCPARATFTDAKRLGLDHKLCRFLLDFATNSDPIMSTN